MAPLLTSRESHWIESILTVSHFASVQLCSQRCLMTWLPTEVRMWRWPVPSEVQEHPHIHWRSSGGTSGTILTGLTDSPGQLMKWVHKRILAALWCEIIISHSRIQKKLNLLTSRFYLGSFALQFYNFFLIWPSFLPITIPWCLKNFRSKL